MLKLKKIFFKYKNTSSDTLSGVSLTLDQGEVLAVVGPSGGGKSTLLRVIAGLEIPHRGGVISIGHHIVLDNQQVVKPEKRGVGMLFQDYALFPPHMTVEKKYSLWYRPPTQERT